MSEARWTSGPWFAVKDMAGCWCVKTRRDKDDENAVVSDLSANIASGIGDHTESRTSGNEEDNANLIAASPDMAEALQRLLDSYIAVTDGDPDIDPDVIRARAALAKARGES